MDNYIVNKTLHINATPDKVWDALTNPDKTEKYFFHCRVQSSWLKGAPIAFKGKVFLFFTIELKGTILEIEPSRLLKYTLGNSGSSTHSTVTEVLTFNNGITTLQVADDVGGGEGAEKRYRRSMAGWDKALKGLKKLVESA